MGEFKFSSLVFISGLVMLGLAGVSLFLGHQGFAQKLFQITFWAIISGTFIYFLEVKFKK